MHRDEALMVSSGLLDPAIPEALTSYVNQYIPFLLKPVSFWFLSIATRSPNYQKFSAAKVLDAISVSTALHPHEPAPLTW